jgi:hypothetical protein
MKTYGKSLFYEIAAAGLGLWCLPVLADIPVPSFDEFGRSAYHGPLTSFPHAIIPDPSGGVAEPVLIYYLVWNPAYKPTPGDVVLMDPATAEWSDVIRFTTANYNGQQQSALIFYSNGADGIDAPADVSTMPSLQANTLFINEVDPITAYWPQPGQPGFWSWTPYVFYTEGPMTFPISDTAATFTLLGLATAGVLVARGSCDPLRGRVNS